MTVAEQIGRNLKGIRRAAYMSQDELSRRSGLHYSEISLLERGGRVPRLDTCIKILESVGGDPRDLVKGVAWHESARWDRKGWFTISGLDGPVDVRPPRRGKDGG
jgi:transcriptional regulator with XRE-family HTH domain